MSRLAAPLALVLLAAPSVLAQGRNFSPDPAAAPAGRYALDRRHSSVTARVSHYGFANYTLVFRGLDGALVYDPKAPAQSRVSFTVDPKSVDSGIADFDRELASDDWLGPAPIRFVSTGLKATGPRSGRLSGDLTLKGVTRPVAFDVTFNGGGPNLAGRPTIGFTAEGVIDRTQFGVTRMAGPIGEQVRLVVDAEFNRS